MKSKAVSWHFPRTALAEQILESFASAALSRGTIYAPRRQGKTEFILQDLLPLAQGKGWTVAYVNLWDDKDHPHLATIAALRDAVERTRRRSLVRRLLSTPINTFKAQSDIPVLASLSAEMSFAEQPGAAAAEDILKIRELLADLVKPRRKVLLAIDEIQHLATSTKFERLAFALRTQLDTLGGKLSVIFTGSSWAGLACTFAHSAMPFYQSAQQLPFPDLEAEFVGHTASCFEHLSSRTLARQALLAFFEAHGRSPFHLQSLVKRMLVSGHTDVVVARAEYEEAVREQVSLEVATPYVTYAMQRIRAGQPLFGNDALAALAQAESIDAAAARHRVKRALARLEQEGKIARVGRGKYLITAD